MTTPTRPAAEALHPLSEALLAWLGQCENYTRSDCRGNGRGPRESVYGAERWCSPCEVRDRLPAVEAAVRADADAALRERVAALESVVRLVVWVADQDDPDDIPDEWWRRFFPEARAALDALEASK